jgi:hypothetical protein
MQTPLHKLVDKYHIPKAWLAELCGFTRTQVSNWVTDPDKYPIPADKKKLIEDRLRKLGSDFKDLELI